ncbi:MAG: 4-hydroxybenzoate octaprenyltransferase, partial [Pseudomonadota bacterium]|nr:4-hydroxybenzoate octaprenyltransferase [Pseudomonadota bacterium]
WLLFALAFVLIHPILLILPAGLGLLLGGAHFAWQIATLDISDPARCLKLFKSNGHFGWILFLGLFATVAVVTILQSY